MNSGTFRSTVPIPFARSWKRRAILPPASPRWPARLTLIRSSRRTRSWRRTVALPLPSYVKPHRCRRICSLRRRRHRRSGDHKPCRTSLLCTGNAAEIEQSVVPRPRWFRQNLSNSRAFNVWDLSAIGLNEGATANWVDRWADWAPQWSCAKNGRFYWSRRQAPGM